MPPKGKRGANLHQGKSGEEEREEPFQAVVFADSFELRFNPFSLEQPRCLLPLANTPLIEYTLEFLASSGVDEVFLCCGNHTDAVEEYLSKSKWMSTTAPFSLEIVRSDANSVGDCMRHLHTKDIIAGDFLCVYGDVVANISLEAAMRGHKTRVAKDKKAIMTMVLREAGENHRAKAKHVRPTFVLDESTGRCVHYEQLRPGQNATLDIPGEVLREAVDLEVREDLIDCGIDICTPEVLAQYTDNFDWQLPRSGFVKGVLKDFETFQLTIHSHVVSEGYAARVKDLQTYDAISKDVVSRWTYPLTPDTNLVQGQNFQLHKGNVYRESGVVLARSSVVSRNVILGKATSVGEHSTIRNAVIGRRCVIGTGVKIDGAHIWDDAYIGDDTVLEKCIIGNRASIGKHCKVEEGALISYGAKISDGTTVPGNQRISTLKRKRGYGKDDLVQAASDAKVVGEGGVGYHVELDEDEEELAESVLVGIQNMDLAVDDISDFDTDDSGDSDEDGSELHHVRSASTRSDSFASIDSDESGEGRKEAHDFHREAVNSLFDDMQKNKTPDTMRLELGSLRMTANAEDRQIRRAIAVAFTKRIANLVEHGSSPKDAVGQVFTAYKSLLDGYLKEEDWQAELLLFLQTDLVHRPQGEKILLFLSNALATSDMVEAEAFEAWWNDARSSASEQLEAVRKDTKQLVDVLVGDDEDEDEEEEEDSEEESEEE
ncbi:translation initiation factor eIF-2B subunit epsilon [Lecanosticta acicola]|uniref:Mannose-1-phosphate guanyltransferase n=1 Tax=Lecanosticta acicola TaxID=111012 RepID=A0AAI8Z8J3_9PEZI|nr:translation initiation factor eIF-2B subunit epsilon [Lecanosticta acicola]